MDGIFLGFRGTPGVSLPSFSANSLRGTVILPEELL
jgi:hypothetical protein